MKRLLLILLGFFVFLACSDDFSAAQSQGNKENFYLADRKGASKLILEKIKENINDDGFYAIESLIVYTSGLLKIKNHSLQGEVALGQSWWERWGRCAAGIVAETAIGALIGGSTFGIYGAVVGGVAGVLVGCAASC